MLCRISDILLHQFVSLLQCPISVIIHCLEAATHIGPGAQKRNDGQTTFLLPTQQCWEMKVSKQTFQHAQLTQIHHVGVWHCRLYLLWCRFFHCLDFLRALEVQLNLPQLLRLMLQQLWVWSHHQDQIQNKRKSYLCGLRPRRLKERWAEVILW